jgi:hypothetical protein
MYDRTDRSALAFFNPESVVMDTGNTTASDREAVHNARTKEHEETGGNKLAGTNDGHDSVVALAENYQTNRQAFSVGAGRMDRMNTRFQTVFPGS